MNPLITSALYWRGFVAKLIISTIVITALAVSGSLTGIKNWHELTGTQQIVIICTIIGVAGNNIISLLDKTFAQKVAEQEDVTNPNAPSPLATKAENPTLTPPATGPKV